MKSMRRMIGMIAVAVAGATMGVGATFGWWQEPATELQENSPVKPDSDRLNNPSKSDPTAAGENKASLKEDVQYLTPGPQIRLNVNKRDIKARINTTKANESDTHLEREDVIEIAKSSADPRHPHNSLNKLIQDLETEAKSCEDEGQKEMAASHRRVLDRLRSIRDSTQPHNAFTLGDPIGKPANPNRLLLPAKVIVENQPKQMLAAKLTQEVVDLQQKLNLTRAEDTVTRQILEARMRELNAQLGQLNAAAKEDRVLEYRIQTGPFPNLTVPRLESPPGFRAPFFEDHLKNIAEQLDKSGQQDAARSIREGAEKLKKDLREDPPANRKEYRVLVEPNGDRITIYDGQDLKLERPLQGAEGRQRVVVMQDREVPRKPAPVAVRREIELHHPESAHKELREILTDLRHEITQLREEVRGLRKELQQGRHRDEAREDESKDVRKDRLSTNELRDRDRPPTVKGADERDRQIREEKRDVEAKTDLEAKKNREAVREEKPSVERKKDPESARNSDESNEDEAREED